jgi:hypothetical protein
MVALLEQLAENRRRTPLRGCDQQTQPTRRQRVRLRRCIQLSHPGPSCARSFRPDLGFRFGAAAVKSRFTRSGSASPVWPAGPINASWAARRSAQRSPTAGRGDHVGSVEARVHPGHDQPGRAAPLRRRDHSDWIARPDPRCSATPTSMCRRVYTPAVDSGTPSLGTGFSWWLVCGPVARRWGAGAECRRGGQ